MYSFVECQHTKRVKGNEVADTLAKGALEQNVTVPISYGKGEGKAVIKKKGMEI